MLIELKEPFKSKWRKGYLRYSNIDQRGRVDLYNSEQDRTTISYARYLKSVELGYEIPEGYEVDHNNVDKTDDSIGNLFLLTKEEHTLKTAKERSTGRNIGTFECPNCGLSFEREIRFTKNSSKLFCSKRCNGLYYYKTNSTIKSVSDETVCQIKSLRKQNKSSRDIANLLGISKSTVNKYSQ